MKALAHLFQCSSASRKFLNVSFGRDGRLLYRFQCSSASRKFLNRSTRVRKHLMRQGFSALQRAENSSITLKQVGNAYFDRFSALQRAENSSIMCSCRSSDTRRFTVSVLFSEPKIPQSRCSSYRAVRPVPVSVLFSEPKIPQLVRQIRQHQRSRAFQCSSASRKFLNSAIEPSQSTIQRSFSALQRAENSSIPTSWRRASRRWRFQCSSASRKFLNASVR